MTLRWLTLGCKVTLPESSEDGVDVDSLDRSGWAVLAWASQQGHLKVAEWLLQNGADVDKKLGLSEVTPLELSCAYGQLGIAKLLIRYGANVNSKCSVGWTPLHSACMEGNTSVASFSLIVVPTLSRQQKPPIRRHFILLVSGVAPSALFSR